MRFLRHFSGGWSIWERHSQKWCDLNYTASGDMEEALNGLRGRFAWEKYNKSNVNTSYTLNNTKRDDKMAAQLIKVGSVKIDVYTSMGSRELFGEVVGSVGNKRADGLVRIAYDGDGDALYNDGFYGDAQHYFGSPLSDFEREYAEQLISKEKEETSNANND